MVHALHVAGAEVQWRRVDDAVDPVAEVAMVDAVVLGPGPGRHDEAPFLMRWVSATLDRRPLLGVCLGHQALAAAVGARIVRHPVVHGHAPPLHHHGEGLFEGLPSPVAMTRYHSLVVEPQSLPEPIVVDAWGDDGSIQAIHLAHRAAWGVQFHPESVLSGEAGLSVLRRFVSLAERANAPA